jgi:hypothetical protein
LPTGYQGNEAGLRFLKEMRNNFPFPVKEAGEKDTVPAE